MNFSIIFACIIKFIVLLQEYETVFEDSGGFDALYLRMLAAGIPTTIQLMWIPLSELDLSQQFLLVVNFTRECITGLLRTSFVSGVKNWTFEKIRDVNDDIMILIVFPLLEFVIPYQVTS